MIRCIMETLPFRNTVLNGKVQRDQMYCRNAAI